MKDNSSQSQPVSATEENPEGIDEHRLLRQLRKMGKYIFIERHKALIHAFERTKSCENFRAGRNPENLSHSEKWSQRRSPSGLRNGCDSYRVVRHSYLRHVTGPHT